MSEATCTNVTNAQRTRRREHRGVHIRVCSGSLCHNASDSLHPINQSWPPAKYRNLNVNLKQNAWTVKKKKKKGPLVLLPWADWFLHLCFPVLFWTIILICAQTCNQRNRTAKRVKWEGPVGEMTLMPFASSLSSFFNTPHAALGFPQPASVFHHADIYNSDTVSLDCTHWPAVYVCVSVRGCSCIPYYTQNTGTF